MINHIAILLDRSSSMRELAGQVIKTYNEQAQHITRKAEETGQRTLLSLYTFSDIADQPILVECPLDLVTLKPLTMATYAPAGMTAMLDSVGLAVEQLSKFERGTDDSFLVIVITDGEENHSRTYPHWSVGWGRISNLIRVKNATDKWSFVFLVPKGKKQALMSRLAVYDGNVQEWDTTSERGVQEYQRITTQGLDNYFAARKNGKAATRGFFTDLSNLKRSDVTSHLAEVTDRFVERPVLSDGIAIKEFCTYNFGNYTTGNAYYELNKPETVQSGKKILVQCRHSGKVYGGPEARQIIGMPDGVEFKVKPGDHGNYRVYVQSTSVNRKLVKGTSVMYLTR